MKSLKASFKLDFPNKIQNGYINMININPNLPETITPIKRMIDLVILPQYEKSNLTFFNLSIMKKIALKTLKYENPSNTKPGYRGIGYVNTFGFTAMYSYITRKSINNVVAIEITAFKTAIFIIKDMLSERDKMNFDFTNDNKSRMYKKYIIERALNIEKFIELALYTNAYNSMIADKDINIISNLRGIFIKNKNGKRMRHKGKGLEEISTYGFIIKIEKYK